MASELEKKIIRQLEYYFGDINFPRDRFMQKKLQEGEGWIALEILVTFNRLGSLSKDPEIIAAAIDKAENGLVEISDDRKKLRRNPAFPVPEWNDARRTELRGRTAYVKGFPLEESLDDIISYFDQFGIIESVTRRIAKDKTFKGSCYIIFKDINTCKNFLEQEDIKYKNTELIRKWQNDYFAEKKKEHEEKKAKKVSEQTELQGASAQRLYPKGAMIYFCGIPEGTVLTREDILDKVAAIDACAIIAFIEFCKGDLEGYLRFSAENGAVEFFKKLADGQLEVNGVQLNFKVLEGAEEEDFLEKTAQTIAKMRKKVEKNRKRKGHLANTRETKSRTDE